MRRAEALRAALLFDRRLFSESREVLEAVLADFEASASEETDIDKDILVLATSLLGLIKKDALDFKDQIDGLKLQERAKELSDELPGGSTLFERRKWLNLPTITNF
jgi:hypothetical protein